MTMTRRNVLGTLAGTAAVLAAAESLGLNSGAAPGSPAGSPPPGSAGLRPLPFDPKSLRGLSEKLVTSHWENNYGGAVKNLAKVRDAIAQTGKDTPPFLNAGLRERELTFQNSVILHELYFANLGGSGKADGAVVKAAGEAFGGYPRFEELLRATAMGLAGGSGWALLAYDLHADALRISWSGNHTQTAAFASPLLVVDMYEHAYQMDYGAAAAKYVDAFFANVNWDEVNRRYERALKAARAMKG
jgi:Fe-Mn family superoxide dismutase